jgi:hypothetical protein
MTEEGSRLRRAGLAIIVIAAAGLIGWLLLSTLGAQKFQCEVCVEFKGKTNCANASAVSEAAAAKSAQATACGTLAKGRIESTACRNTRPLSRRCSPIKK